MIKAQHKPLAEIAAMIADYRRILVLGCETCVAICFAGGEKEVAAMAATLRLQDRLNGGGKDFTEGTTKRQCETEFIMGAADLIHQADAVLSLACSVGVQRVAELFPTKPVFPGNNTTFMGVQAELGTFTENCLACGDCLIHLTGGLCPLARCAKRLLNGPCGGSVEGKCEISKDVPCIWQEIYDRMKGLGMLHKLSEVIPTRDWKMNDTLGPRSFVREDLKVQVGKERST